MACHGVISARRVNAGIACLTKLEITPPSFSNHSRYGTWRNGTSGDDTIDLRYQWPWDVKDNADGGGGDDTIYGNMADNELLGRGGNDLIYGGTGNDNILGSQGNDVLYGEDGHDVLQGGTGWDVLDGGAGNDELIGGADNDSFYGGDGNDYIYDDWDDTTVSGADWMDGGDGNDHIYSFNGNDKIYGRAGDDVIVISNTDGHNHLSDSSLEIHGGSGSDMLVFANDGTVTTFDGLGAHTDGIESVKLDYGHTMTLNLSAQQVMAASPTDKLIISGDGSDTLDLTSFLTTRPSPGEQWLVTGAHNAFDANGLFTSFTTFDYMKDGNVLASVDVENAIHVTVHDPVTLLSF
jgi:Ca2+-binding RTX toxin-like protein